MNRDGRDDEDTAPAWRSPRPSEPTRVGLGVIEGSRARSDTTDRDVGNGPPTPRSRVSAELARSDATIIMQQLTDLRRDFLGKVDVCITDVRALAQQQRASTDGTRREMRALRAYAMHNRDEVKELAATVAAIPDHSLAVAALQELVGQPPKAFDPRASIVEEMTAEQIQDMREKGTGLFRLFGQLAHVDRQIVTSIAQAAGRAAGRTSGVISSVLTTAATTAPSWAPPLVEMLSKLFGG
jgi:hypothetical protein